MNGTLAEIRLFGGNFAPKNWQFCEGQILQIISNQALFSLLGTTYGGDGRTTFALPDLRGRTAIGEGQGSGLTNRNLGQQLGTAEYTLNVNQLPAHTHSAAHSTTFYQLGIDEKDNNPSPEGRHPSKTTNAGNPIYRPDSNTTMAQQTIQFVALDTGGNQPVNHTQPGIGMQFIICTSGLFPSRS
ncbi:MAG: phage tail protein [Bacteroidetes bacterium]|nr:phage tail protein [Bacteroidota bacterium]